MYNFLISNVATPSSKFIKSVFVVNNDPHLRPHKTRLKKLLPSELSNGKVKSSGLEYPVCVVSYLYLTGGTQTTSFLRLRFSKAQHHQLSY